MYEILENGRKIVLEDSFKRDIIIALLNDDYGLSGVTRNQDDFSITDEVEGFIGTANHGTVEFTMNIKEDV